MKTSKIYINMEIKDNAELRFMQHTLVENLHLLSQLDDEANTNRAIKDSLFWITKILQSVQHENI